MSKLLLFRIPDQCTLNPLSGFVNVVIHYNDDDDDIDTKLCVLQFVLVVYLLQ